MSSIISEGDDYSKYSAFDESGITTLGDSTAFAIQSKTAAGSLSLADVKSDNQRARRRKEQREYSRDEFLYALSSPSSIGAIAWIVSSFVAVIYGSSIVVYINFCIPLLVGPYVIREQMPAQKLPSVRSKFNKLRSEANALAIKNVQLKGTVSRMQRQEYRLSATEERFEHLCKRGEKDIVKMKQLARKNAALRQKIKVNLAGKKLQELLTNMLTVDFNGNCLISEIQIDEVVILMKVFAGKNASSKFDKNAIHRAVINSIAKNMKTTFLPNVESDTETRDSEGDYYERLYSANEGERMYSNEEETESGYSKSYKGKSNDDTQGEESWAVSKKNKNGFSLKLDPSGHLHEGRHNKEDPRDVMRTNMSSGTADRPIDSSGTADRPIDIEKLLFHNHIPKQEQEEEHHGHYYSKNSKMITMTSPNE